VSDCPRHALNRTERRRGGTGGGTAPNDTVGRGAFLTDRCPVQERPPRGLVPKCHASTGPADDALPGAAAVWATRPRATIRR
jgi:hypothetical protein